MPRDLLAERDQTSIRHDQLPNLEAGAGNGVNNTVQKADKRNELHPYVRPLTVGDVDQCVDVENATFPEDQRATREKFQYRFSKCGELSLGLFTRKDTAPNSDNLGSEEHRPMGEILLAHCVATKCNENVVTDEAMELPPHWDQYGATPSDLGHQEIGRTLAVHSLAVRPGYQRRGLGKTIMKSYIQRMSSAGLSDRIALICHDYLIPFYESLGFHKIGESKAQFGGGGWYDMVLEFADVKADLLEAV